MGGGGGVASGTDGAVSTVGTKALRKAVIQKYAKKAKRG